MVMICRFLPLLLLFAHQANSQPVLISEYLPAPSTHDQEFIELILKGSSNVSTGDVTVRDRSPRWSHVDPAYELVPGDTLLLFRYIEKVPETFSPTIKIATLSPWPILNNTGDSLVVQVSALDSDRTGYSSAPAGRSIERKSDVIPGYIESNWAPSRDPAGSTPGRRNSVYEVDTTAPRVLGAELSLNNQLWIWMSEALPRNQSVRLQLHQNQGPSFSMTVHSMGGHSLTSLEVPDRMWTDVSVSSTRDYAGYESEPSTVEIARAPVRGEVTINEVLYHDKTGGVPEFIELFVASDHSISLRELSLSTNQTLFSLVPQDTTLLAPSGAAVLLSAGNMDAAVDQAAISFAREAKNPHLEHLTSPSAILTAIIPSLRIPNRESTIRLHVQSDTLDAMSINEVCFSPRFETYTGRSVRRQADLPCKWTHSLLSVGTSPGLISLPVQASPPIAGDLRISEVLYDTIEDAFDNRADQVEFIELMNVGDEPLDIGGLYFSGPETDLGKPSDLPFLHAQTRLSVGEIALVFHYPRDFPDDALHEKRLLRSIWPNSHGPARTIFLPVRQRLGLSNTGELILLMSSQGIELDRVWIGKDRHHPAVKNTKGRSIVRLLSATGQLGNWSSSTHEDGATPGYAQPVQQTDRPKSGLRIDRTSIYPTDDSADNVVHIEVASQNPSDIVRIRVFSADGHDVTELVAGKFVDNGVSVAWNGRDENHNLVSAGIYIIVAHVFDSISGSHRSYKKAVAVLL